jgi:hypothetical protein
MDGTNRRSPSQAYRTYFVGVRGDVFGDPRRAAQEILLWLCQGLIFQSLLPLVAHLFARPIALGPTSAMLFR